MALGMRTRRTTSRGRNTNVVRFREAYRGQSDPVYFEGVGTRLGLLGRVFGGLIGAGGRDRVRDAYDQLCANWEQGDTDIDIVGFSRGAALALHFANHVRKRGIRAPGSRQVVERDPRIRFVGLWDTVASFGIPINVGFLPFQRINPRLAAQSTCKRGLRSTRARARRAFVKRSGRRGRAWRSEVWFRGVHSDVGGGNGNLGLNSIALRWMLRKAMAAGLPIDPDAVQSANAEANPAAEIRPAQRRPDRESISRGRPTGPGPLPGAAAGRTPQSARPLSDRDAR